MSRARKKPSQLHRLFLSSGMVCVLILLTVLSGDAISYVQTIVGGFDTVGSIVRSDEDDANFSLGDFPEISPQDLPQEIREEVLNIPENSSVYFDEDAMILGFSCNTSSEQAFSDIVAKLQTRGWTNIQSGSSQTGTLIKQTGKLRWMYLTCTHIANQTSVVMQFVAS